MTITTTDTGTIDADATDAEVCELADQFADTATDRQRKRGRKGEPTYIVELHAKGYPCYLPAPEGQNKPFCHLKEGNQKNVRCVYAWEPDDLGKGLLKHNGEWLQMTFRFIDGVGAWYADGIQEIVAQYKTEGGSLAGAKHRMRTGEETLVSLAVVAKACKGTGAADIVSAQQKAAYKVFARAVSQVARETIENDAERVEWVDSRLTPYADLSQ